MSAAQRLNPAWRMALGFAMVSTLVSTLVSMSALADTSPSGYPHHPVKIVVPSQVAAPISSHGSWPKN